MKKVYYGSEHQIRRAVLTAAGSAVLHRSVRVWTTPVIVGFGLPAHAQTSAVNEQPVQQPDPLQTTEPPAPPPLPDSPEPFDTPGLQSLTIPEGVSRISIVARGGSGGDAQPDEQSAIPGTGGEGGVSECSVDVAAGDVVEIFVGAAGGIGANGNGGAGGRSALGFDGGAGGSSPSFLPRGGGGGGGGASGVRRNGAEVVVAGGGGGGGGANFFPGQGGNGGNGGGSGSDGQEAIPGSPIGIALGFLGGVVAAAGGTTGQDGIASGGAAIGGGQVGTGGGGGGVQGGGAGQGPPQNTNFPFAAGGAGGTGLGCDSSMTGGSAGDGNITITYF